MKSHTLILIILTPAIALLMTNILMASTGPVETASEPFEWWQLIKPFGISTIVLVLCTASLGLLRKLKYKVMIKLHKISAALTVVSAITHATIVIFL